MLGYIDWWIYIHMEDTSTLLFYSTQVFSIIFLKGDTIVLGFWVLLEAWDTFGQDLIEIILLNLQDVLPELSGDDVRAKKGTFQAWCRAWATSSSWNFAREKPEIIGDVKTHLIGIFWPWHIHMIKTAFRYPSMSRYLFLQSEVKIDT